MSPGRPRAFLGLLVALASALGEGGCAVMMQQPPKENRASGEVPICSTGRGGVALDGVMAALLGAAAVAALAGDEPGVALGVGAVGGIYTWSAVTGYRSAGACEEALADYKMELAAHRRLAPATAGAPRPLGPPIDQAASPPAEEIPRPAEEIPQSAEEVPPPAEESPPPAEENPQRAEETPRPAAETPPPAAASRPAPGAWSDFWVEVPK